MRILGPDELFDKAMQHVRKVHDETMRQKREEAKFFAELSPEQRAALAKGARGAEEVAKIEEATARTRQALEAIGEIENTLKHALNVDYTIDWEALKGKSGFSEPKPQLPDLLVVPQPPEEPDPPGETHWRYQPQLGLLDKILPSRRKTKIDNAKLRFKVGSSRLHSLTPVAPILNISREDKRFVSSYEVAGDLDESSNLAAMDWEDFEHLIREVFEKEFSKTGGEVKITQASRDRGVDAVVFDPDPIHGGKIVIQAKRYTNTVGVSAVRDLCGTVINEGATKGILVTTADYGPDAYEFAKGKPLTLLNGGHLLHLLRQHGHRVTIDLKAAKRVLSGTDKE